MSSIGVQDVLNAAMAANMTSIGSGEASKVFRAALNGSVKVRINLKPEDKAYLTRTCTFPLVFTGEKTVTTDHALLSAMREITRDIYESMFKVSHLLERTLVVGSSAREIRNYHSNANIHHYFYGKENKDYDRTIREAYNDIMKNLKAKASKKNTAIYLEKEPNTTVVRPVLKRYLDVQHVFNDYCKLNKLPATIHTDITGFRCMTLLFEDSIYNFGVDELTKIFRDTGANVAYGYALLPMELLFDEMPTNRIYTIKKDTKTFGSFVPLASVEYTTMTFKNGYSNGYSHPTHTWETLLKYPAMTMNGVSLGVEIVSRVGCMAVFKIYRCTHPEEIVRSVELDTKDMYVKMLDVWASIDHASCKFRRPLKYFSVREEEYFETYNYLMALDPKSLNLQNCITYVRRRMGGMSLVNKELVAPWDLPRADVHRFSIAVTMQAMLMHDKIDKAFLESKPTSTTEKLKRWFSLAVRTAFYPIVTLLEFLFEEHLTDKIVVWPDHLGAKFQNAKVQPIDFFKLDMTSAFPNEDDLPECPFCMEMHGNLGDQKLKCEYQAVSDHEFALSKKQVDEMFVKLADDDNDAPGLRAVKKACKDNAPREPFSYSCRVTYICGGPGCGKSVMIRKLADENDMVLAPFTKLMDDYINLKDEVTGETYNLNFKTTHRAMGETGKRRIFVDEFSSFDYSILAAVVYRNKPDEVILVGDTKQTKIQEPDEGLYIGNYIDMDKLSKHTLRVNFRNPQDTVALLNQRFGYEMIAASEIKQSIEFTTIDTFQPPLNCLRMGFSKDCTKLYCADEKKCTVRSNQGGTAKKVALYVTNLDGRLPSVDELAIVAISRHVEKLYVVGDGSEVTKQFLAKLDISQDFKDHIQEFIQFPITDTKAITNDDAVVKEILEPFEKSPKDSHLLVDTLIPNVALDSDTTSLNWAGSQCVADAFRSASTNVADLFVKINQRGHPVDNTQRVYQIGPGLGSSFSAKMPFQELSVCSQRYDNPKPGMPLTEESKKFADEIIDAYFEECKMKKWQGVDIVHGFSALDDDQLNELATAYVKNVQTKHYDKQWKGIDNPDIKTVRFHLKTIFKPNVSIKKFDEFKAGQGVSAWNPNACSMFCYAFRIIGEVDRMTDRDDPDTAVYTDNGISEIDFMETVCTRLRKFSGLPMKHGLTDAEMFDSNQNEWTQYLEYRYHERLGVSTTFLDFYYSFRHDVPIFAGTFKTKLKHEKTSGEPGTLLNNGVVTKLLGNYVVRGRGPKTIVYKGDDFDKSQMDMFVDEDRLLRIKSCCPLRLRVVIQDNGEFCGLIITPNGFMPNLFRRVNKIVAQRFRDYPHFCEYQKSLREYVKLCNSIGPNETLKGTMAVNNCTVEEAEALFYFIESVSHLNEAQFYALMHKCEETDSVPVASSSNKKGVVFCV